MQKQTHLGMVLAKSDKFTKKENEENFPPMRGNIGPTAKYIKLEKETTPMEKKLFSRMDEEFDIERIIPDINR